MDAALSSAPLPAPAARLPAGARALIFDMDGTMVDSMPSHTWSWEAFARSRGVALETAELMRMINGRTAWEGMRALLGDDLPADALDRLVAEKEGMYRDHFARTFAEVDGFVAFEALARARGLATGIGTAGDRHNIAFVLERLAMAPPQAMVGGNEGLPGKPEPAIFLEVARRLGVPPAQCVVFEDAPFGIEAARRAGMRAVAICTSHPPDELSGPHVVAAVPDYQSLLQTNFLGNST